MRRHVASTVLSAAFLSRVLSFAKTCSMGLRSGLADENRNDRHGANYPRQAGRLSGSVRICVGSGGQLRQVFPVKRPVLKLAFL